MKSYNTRALRGDTEYTDNDFKQDLLESGINVPDYLLYKPEMNDYVLNEIYKQSCNNLTQVVNPKTSVNYTSEEAQEEASALRSQAKKNINALL
jgi:hypothetical protein